MGTIQSEPTFFHPAMTTQRDIDPETVTAMAHASPRLGKDDIIRLCSEGDNDARWRIVLANVRLALKAANHHYRRGTFPKYPLDDMIQDAIIGLYDAASHYDPERGSFSTCAMYWITHHLRRSYADRWTDIRVPVHHHEQGFSAKPHQRRTARMTLHTSLFEPVQGERDERLTVGGTLADPSDPYADIEDIDACQSLLEYVVHRYLERRRAYVTSEERLRTYLDRLLTILQERKKGRSMADIGRSMGVSRQWIAMIVDEVREYIQDYHRRDYEEPGRI